MTIPSDPLPTYAPVPNATSPCPLCGAALHGETCRERFDRCLALEFEQPAYGVVHHLTVTCYMLQHNGYTGAVWQEARQMLHRFVVEGETPQAMRAVVRNRLSASSRPSITRGAKLTGFPSIRWSQHIGSICPDDPVAYATSITRWASSILTDTEGLTRPDATPKAGGMAGRTNRSIPTQKRKR